MTSQINFDLKFVDFQKQILDKYGKYSWSTPTYENECEKSKIEDKFTLNPTQKFVTRFVKPDNPNGLLLYHSVGAGKTISALSIARRFENGGFSIIWVTRSSLRKDIEKGLNLIPLHKKFMVISYKQFSNILKKKGLAYEALEQQKGTKDILNKTLVIIDEAHKLYTYDLKPQEMHDIKVIEKGIFDSYDKSGPDAVKLLLMTATPVTENPIEMIHLLNILIEDPSMRFNIPMFNTRYLDETGNFSKKGLKRFSEKVKGLISYLDLTNDPRRFAQVEHIEKLIPISEAGQFSDTDKMSARCIDLKNMCLEDKINKDICLDNYKRCMVKVKQENVKNKNNVSQLKQLSERCKIKI